MVTKRPLASTSINSSKNGEKQIRYDLSHIKPLILKRSEIFKNCATATVADVPPNSSENDAQCLRQGGSSTCFIAQREKLDDTRKQDTYSVQFRPNVTVRRIPSRHDYPKSTRSELWSSLEEIRENALRNEAEFLFDGGNWRACCEEEDMFYDLRSGSLVHPAHVETVCVFNGKEWKPISKDETTVITTPPQHACIVYDYPGSSVA